jgi:hypothetical protein
MEKFFLETSREHNTSNITRNAKDLMVLVALPSPKMHLRVYITKNGNRSVYETSCKSDEFNIIKPTAKADFYKAYNSCLRNIHQVDLNDGEFYLVKKKQSPALGIAWFSKEEKRRLGLLIEFYDDKKDFQLSIDYNIQAGKIAHHFRKAGNTLSPVVFRSFYNGVLNFLHDPENYHTGHAILMDQYRAITVGEVPEITVFTSSSWDPNNNIAIEKITNRITAIERRLIELDTDTSSERMKMRGELEGLKFALIAIQHG